MRWQANVTVAAVIEKGGRFLMIEEEIDGLVVINQPAGHLEIGESLLEATKREVLEETAWDFEPEKVVSIYLYPSPHNEITYLRICLSGACIHHHLELQLDDGIIQAIWLTREELEARENSLRSPLVIRCIDDYLSGQQYPLELLNHIY